MAKAKAAQIFIKGFWEENPVSRQILGICSALAVTNLMTNTLIMGVSLIFVTAMSNVTVSALRNVTPARIRMMVQVLIIACYVIVVDIVLKAYLPDISRALGPYVGLIITNCIIMGRCEGFARGNPVWPSLVDGIACGAGYAAVLLLVAFIRELLGFGSLFGVPVLPADWTRWTIMVMAPGAFFVLGAIIWLVSNLGPKPKKA
ncbi:MAG: NADH:ubiquinone reductase (Na(+)-transporting) subunit D [Syntrophobacteraceae bacterium CG2_30_61_12]|nr:MAG: NADH:ubiquinone reductase (Na(+)-transporting) subunit D [Syntrophobacteraceae bacterium CG2_30_61_12]PIU30701.1 MAG: NADH:ubiquinone reductase (Na(+)-transporting) subunit D [Syntrophobacteraceae bacterium CG07_land_8_20_14_0_80_61_8]